MKNLTAALAAAVLAVSLGACAELEKDKATDSSTAAAGGNVDVVKESKSPYTMAQQNAIGSAKDYLSTSAFSRKGLIEQLASKAGEGYGLKLATFAVNHIRVNWNEQAVKSAKDYLSTSNFSRSELIDQLSSSAGEGYTRAQALYAVNKVYR